MDGASRLNVRFDAPRAREVEIAIRYVPQDPWWLSTKETKLRVRLRPPSWWWRLSWILPLGLVGLALARAWRRPQPASVPAPRKPPGKAVIEVLQSSPDRTTWRGSVIDAHDGAAIAGALMEISTARLDGTLEAYRTHTAADGTFVLKSSQPLDSEGCRLSVSAPTHTSLVQRLPPAGELKVAMVSRRRNALNELVRWAKRSGRSWSAGQDVTPGEVARLAKQREESALRAWAEAVENAAYGSQQPDAGVEQRLHDLHPTSTRRER